MNGYRLGTQLCLADEVVCGRERLHHPKWVPAPGVMELAVCSRSSIYSGTLSADPSVFGTKMSEGTLISPPVSILNGETPVDVWTVALYARRTRPRLKFQSSGCASLVKAFSSSIRVQFVLSTWQLPCGFARVTLAGLFVLVIQEPPDAWESEHLLGTIKSHPPESFDHSCQIRLAALLADVISSDAGFLIYQSCGRVGTLRISPMMSGRIGQKHGVHHNVTRFCWGQSAG
ncbi:hypothetical protein EmuJ_001114200 [Echinococcus multilocularis]|uniref:Uncharacterized protein n=1 Tax=Echinococcus multilocularis TaxID=6211 RepID=A0A068YFN0_ECHMU|nr:hypothetical protein EmuJ_001114200 [Echinococcus multilocularis]